MRYEFRYEVGLTYEHNGPVEVCFNGFHACEHPLDVLWYYPPARSRFAVVELSGELEWSVTDSKIAGSRITIKRELTLAELIQAAVKYTFTHAKHLGESGSAERGDVVRATDDYCASSAMGVHSAACATGRKGAASATGFRGAACAEHATAVAVAAGWDGRARGVAGAALVLVERDEDGRIVHVWSGIVGRGGIKPDIWYELHDGKPVEVKD